jgi:DNA-binding NtrC family response regulator
MTGRVLVVEDDPVARKLLAEVLKRDGLDVRSVETAKQALVAQDAFDPGVVITDVRLTGMDGIALLRRLRERRPAVQVVVVTAFGSLDTAVEAIRQGAYDYVSKPFPVEDMCRTVRRALEAHTAAAEPHAEDAEPEGELVGRCKAMTDVFTAIARVASLRVSVLIFGETGTGKELVARAIHERGTRSNRPFVTVNCVSLPEGLMESELFGHVKGAFTGANSDRKGLFEAAEGGTILLDEIGDMPLAVQAKLLRVLESGEIRPVGSTNARTVNTRVLASTHRELGRAVQGNQFRQDLYYRLNAVTISVPPLRGRLPDLPLLVEHLLKRHAKSAGRPVPRLTEAAFTILGAYSWPGNVRELSHVLERSVALARANEIDVDDLPPHLATPSVPEAAPASLSLDEVEKAHVLAVLKSVEGNRVRAAAILGIDRKTLYRKLLRYGVEVGEGAP